VTIHLAGGLGFALCTGPGPRTKVHSEVTCAACKLIYNRYAARVKTLVTDGRSAPAAQSIASAEAADDILKGMQADPGKPS